MVRTIAATRYVTPLREGGSLPAIVEADDQGLYVVKFRGAGQGTLALAAELIVGELARALELPVPELVMARIDPALGRNEPDAEIRDLLNRSAGLNVGMDYLPGSIMFCPAARHTADAALASRIVWFDAFTANVDRTVRNPNLLRWHQKLYLIDHGAALYFHHDWDGAARVAVARFPIIKEHVLLPWATKLRDAGDDLAAKLTPEVLLRAIANVPPEWLTAEPERYVEFFAQRLANRANFEEEAQRAHAGIV